MINIQTRALLTENQIEQIRLFFSDLKGEEQIAKVIQFTEGQIITLEECEKDG
jgi:hypothetical protein